MSRNPWDSAAAPNLSRLPAEERAKLNEPIPLREFEQYARVILFNRFPGLNEPNGRVLAVAYRANGTSPGAPPDGAQLDCMDFTGKIPLASLVLRPSTVKDTITSLIRIYLAMGNTDESIASLIQAAKAPPKYTNTVSIHMESARDE